MPQAKAPADRAVLRAPRQRRGMAMAIWGIAMTVLLGLTFKPLVQDDGVGYFAYLHSVVLDHDLRLDDEFAAARQEHVVFYTPLFDLKAAGGRAADYFPIGPATLTLPFYLTALAVRSSGKPEYGPPFSSAICLASLLFGLLALALSYRLAARIAGPRAALAGTIGAALATPYIYYLVYQPSYSHTFSAFAVALFLTAWWAGRNGRSALGWFGLGLLGGLMALIRFQDGLLILIALIGARRAGWRPVLLVPGALLAFLPQLWVDQAIFASWLPPRPPGQALSPVPGHYLQVLFSSYHGLLVWTPAFVIAAAGFWLVPDRRLRLAAAYALLIEVIVNGATPDWWGGFSFGLRRFLDLTPFVALGLAVVASRVPRWTANLGLAALVAWNVLLIANFTYVIRTDRDPGYLGLAAGQLAALRHLPNLVAQGAVVRQLVISPWVHQARQPAAALLLLAGEAACVAACLVIALRRVPESSRGSGKPSAGRPGV